MKQRTVLTTVMTKKMNCFEIPLPAKRIVCPICHGEGQHVNPSIDGHGISSEEFNEDPEFRESYFRGDYDVTCSNCNGNRVVDVVDYENLSQKMKDRFDRAEDERYATEREIANERKWGC